MIEENYGLIPRKFFCGFFNSENSVMLMNSDFWMNELTPSFWLVFKSRLIFWTDFVDMKGRLTHQEIWLRSL